MNFIGSASTSRRTGFCQRGTSDKILCIIMQLPESPTEQVANEIPPTERGYSTEFSHENQRDSTGSQSAAIIPVWRSALVVPAATRLVLGMIVHRDDPKLHIFLSRQGAKARPDVRLFVAGGHNHGDGVPSRSRQSLMRRPAKPTLITQKKRHANDVNDKQDGNRYQEEVCHDVRAEP